MQQPMPYPPQRPPSSNNGSQVMIIVAVVLGGLVVFGGIFGVLAISGVRKYVQNAKMAEAMNSVGAMSRSATAAYEAGTPPTLCASASKPVPELISAVAGKKYMSSTADWNRDAAANAGFACLHFEMSNPQYYQYDYQVTGPANHRAAGSTFQAIAKGDLDGDGNPSTFTLTGRIDGAGALDLDPGITQTNPTE